MNGGRVSAINIAFPKRPISMKKLFNSVFAALLISVSSAQAQPQCTAISALDGGQHCTEQVLQGYSVDQWGNRQAYYGFRSYDVPPHSRLDGPVGYYNCRGYGC
jgi:hypothetical protein